MLRNATLAQAMLPPTDDLGLLPQPGGFEGLPKAMEQTPRGRFTLSHFLSRDTDKLHLDLLRNANVRLGMTYNASQSIETVNEQGAVDATTTLINGNQPSEGFTKPGGELGPR
jgi:hypothetical protein